MPYCYATNVWTEEEKDGLLKTIEEMSERMEKMEKMLQASNARFQLLLRGLDVMADRMADAIPGDDA